jgi:beta-phosphoglucomutase-like phosphatase (HAD superfamily)
MAEMYEGGPAPRVRPHVSRAVARIEHVLLDFDGVMFDVDSALGRYGREDAVAHLLVSLEHRPRPLPITLGWFGIHQTLAYLAEHEPDRAAEAEQLVSTMELDAALTAARRRDLEGLLGTCHAARRRVGVISELSTSAVIDTLRAHSLIDQVDAVIARLGLDMSAVDAGPAAERAADILDAPLGRCAVVSGSVDRLRSARDAGAVGIGCECGRDRRKHLAEDRTPVVSNLTALSHALAR